MFSGKSEIRVVIFFVREREKKTYTIANYLKILRITQSTSVNVIVYFAVYVYLALRRQFRVVPTPPGAKLEGL